MLAIQKNINKSLKELNEKYKDYYLSTDLQEEVNHILTKNKTLLSYTNFQKFIVLHNIKLKIDVGKSRASCDKKTKMQKILYKLNKFSSLILSDILENKDWFLILDHDDLFKIEQDDALYVNSILLNESKNIILLDFMNIFIEYANKLYSVNCYWKKKYNELNDIYWIYIIFEN